MNRTFLLICAMTLFTALSWGQTTWDLSETMTATLETDGVLTITTTAESEAMPDNFQSRGAPWYSEQEKIFSVVIGDNVTTIGAYSFIGNSIYGYYTNLTSVTISNSVIMIGESAFQLCRGLTSITMPDSLVSIERSAFAFCQNLESVTFSNSLTTIGYGAFSNCTSLESVAFPDSLVSILALTFSDCTGLKSITIPKSVTTIGAEAFDGCTVLKDVTVEWERPSFILGFSIFDNTFGPYWGYMREATLHVPFGSKPYYQNAPVWRYFGTIKGEIPDEISWDLTSTMKSTLDDNGVLTISTTANAEAMPDFTSPEINPENGAPRFAFRNSILSVVIENKVTTIGDWSFSLCYDLEAITIPNSVTKIGFVAFGSCVGLTSITIPNAVTTIGVGAFADCTGLKSITIPSSVTTLSADVFWGCTGLKDVTVEWSSPLSINDSDNIFQEVNTSAATLHVPSDTKALYGVAPVWKDFGTIAEYDYTGNANIATLTALKAFASGGVLHITGLQAGKPFSVYSLAGQLVYNGIAQAETERIPLNTRGIYFVTSGKQTVKAIVF